MNRVEPRIRIGVVKTVSGMATCLLATAALSIPFGARATVAAQSDDGVRVTGVVLGADGSASGRAPVTVTALSQPNAAGEVRPIVLATTVSDSDGHYSALVEPGQAPQLNGSTVLEVRAETPEGYTFGTATFIESAAQPSTLNSAKGLADAPTNVEINTGDADEGWVPRPTGATEAAATTTVEIADPASDLDLENRAAQGSSCFAGEYFIWVAQNVFKRVLVPVGKASTKTKTKTTYTYVDTKSTSLQVAYTGSTGAYAGGLRKASQRSSELSKSVTANNGASKRLELEWQYQRWQGACVSDTSAGYDYLDRYQWTPKKLTSGDRVLASAPSWSCGAATTVKMSADTYVAKTSSVSWNGFFSVKGVGLDAVTTNHIREQLFINVKAGKTARVCGDVDFPPYAHRVKERS